MSNLLFNATKEAKDGNYGIQEQVRHTRNKFLSSVEIPAQEAIFHLLKLPLYRGTTDVVFINTSHPDQRSVMLKGAPVIEALPEESSKLLSEAC